MKKMIVLCLLVGALIGVSAPTAANWAWAEKGTTYRCTGFSTFVECKETRWTPPYVIGFTSSFVYVRYGSRPIFTCKRKYKPNYGSVCFYHLNR